MKGAIAIAIVTEERATTDNRIQEDSVTIDALKISFASVRVTMTPQKKNALPKAGISIPNALLPY